MIYDLSMEKRKKKEHDFSVTAFKVVQEATGQVETQPEQKETNRAKKGFDPVVLGHLGGLKGGKARAEKLTPQQRSEIAKKLLRQDGARNSIFTFLLVQEITFQIVDRIFV